MTDWIPQSVPPTEWTEVDAQTRSWTPQSAQATSWDEADAVTMFYLGDDDIYLGDAGLYLGGRGHVYDWTPGTPVPTEWNE